MRSVLASLAKVVPTLEDAATILRVLARSSAFGYFVAAAPGAKELITIAKVWELAQAARWDRSGRTYDLSRPPQKDLLVDESLVYWIDRVRTAIRGVDPTALVAIGFVEPHGPHASRPGDSRLIRTQAAIRSSTADFVDVHTYPGLHLTLPQYMENFGIYGPEPKPVIIGQLGAYTSAYPALPDASAVLQSWQRDSCAYGVDGWLAWTWDTDELPELWNALSGGGLIESALSPRAWRDPCSGVR